MRSSATRLTVAAGFTLALAAAFLPLGCAAEEPAFTGVHSTPTAPDPRWLPDGVVEQLRACAEKLPAALPGERTEHLIGFDVQAGRSGAIDRVTLKRSTLGAHGVEACMREVLSGMTLPIVDLAPLLATGGGKHPLSPEARGLLGGGPLIGSIALLPAVLTIARITIVVAVVMYVSYEVVQAIDAYARSTTVAAAAPSATTAATAAAGATVVAPPIAGTRRNPGQTCDDVRLDQLEAQKNTACKTAPWSCSSDKVEKIGRKRQKLLTCPELLARESIGRACHAARLSVQTECFFGSPDRGHETAIKEASAAFEECDKKARDRGCKP